MRIYLQAPGDNGKRPRFYQLILQKDILGGWSLVREWGSQDSPGTLKKNHYSDQSRALNELLKIRDQQIARGYRVMFTQGDEG